MMIHCNVTGSERKRLADVLGAVLLMEPVYKKAPTFTYVVCDYTIDKNGTIFCPVSAISEELEDIITKLNDEGFEPVVEETEPAEADETAEDEAPTEIPAETPDVAPEVEPEGLPEAEATEANVGAETPDAAPPEGDPFATMPEDVENDIPFSAEADDDSLLTVSIPRAKLADDALARLRIIVANKEELFKRALMADALPIEVTDETISFPWFKLTGISGEAGAYSQFISALCQMATEQKRVLDKPYDGDNDRFTMRIFMVRLGMKGPQFALARKLMLKHLDGNSGWRYADSANKPDRSNPNRAAASHLKKAYPSDTRVELVPLNDESGTDIQIGARGTMIGVDDNGSVFIRLENGSAFGIAFSTEQADTDEETPDTAPEAEPEAQPEDEATEAADGDVSPDAADPEEAEDETEENI